MSDAVDIGPALWKKHHDEWLRRWLKERVDFLLGPRATRDEWHRPRTIEVPSRKQSGLVYGDSSLEEESGLIVCSTEFCADVTPRLLSGDEHPLYFERPARWEDEK